MSTASPHESANNITTGQNGAAASPAELPPQAILLQMATGYMISQAIYVAARLGIADFLQDGPKSAAELAAATGSHAPSLYRVLRTLAGVGVFAENDAGRFELTPLAELLRSDAPGSLRDMVLHMTAEWHWRTFEYMLHTVKTGEIAFDHAFGMPIFEYFAQNPEPARAFNKAMSSDILGATPLLVAAYDFSSINTIVDVAGGHGKFIAEILKANPHMHGILYDLPQVIEGAPALLQREGVADRCATIAGDIFQSVPPGGDAYIMKLIIHDWDDERSLTILRNCHRAMAEDGVLLVVDAVIPPGNEPHIGKLIDLEMMLLPGGLERTEAQFETLFEQAGFRLTRVIQTPAPLSIIEGIRV